MRGDKSMIQKFIRPPMIDSRTSNDPTNRCPQNNSHRMLRATSLDQSVTVLALSFIQFTSPIDVLVYDYSYLIVNIGADPAMAYLQISPDGTNWENQSDTKTINTGTLVSLVPDVIAKYARLAYQLQSGTLTSLQIYTQGRSYN